MSWLVDDRPHITVGFAGGCDAGKTILSAMLVHAAKRTETVTIAEAFERSGRYQWFGSMRTITDSAMYTMGYSYKEHLSFRGGDKAHYACAAFPPEVSSHFFTVFDIPRHFGSATAELRAFSMLDIIVVVVDAGTRDKHEIGISKKNGTGCTRDVLASAIGMGVKHVIFALNKLDILPRDLVAPRTLKIEEELIALAVDFGFDADCLQVIPVSGRDEQNIYEPPTSAWFKSNVLSSEGISPCAATPTTTPTRTTLLQAIEAAATITVRERKEAKKAHQPFRLEVSDVFRTKRGDRRIQVVVGRVASGFLTVDSKLIIGPTPPKFMGNPPNTPYAECTVTSIQMHRRAISCASVGDFIGVALECRRIPGLSEFRSPTAAALHERHGRSMFRRSLSIGMVLTDPQCGGLISADSFTATVRYLCDEPAAERGVSLWLCVGPRHQYALRLERVFSQDDKLSEVVQDGQKLRKCGDIFDVQHPRSNNYGFVFNHNEAHFGQRFLLKRMAWGGSKSDATFAVGVITSATFLWDPLVIVKVTVVLRRLVPFEIAHLILNFVLESPPVSLHS